MNHAYAILRRLGISEYKEDKNGEYICYCIFCGDRKYNLQINFDKRLYHCWVCNQGGSLYNLIYDITGLRKKEANSLFHLNEIDVEKSTLYILDLLQKKKQKKYDYKRFRVNGRYRRWRKVGIKRSAVKDFELGYDQYTNRLVIPMFDDMQRCVGLSRRAVSNTQRPKYLHTAEFNKKQFLFGYNSLDKEAEYITITEGAIDCIIARQYGMNSIAILGTSMLEGNMIKIAEEFENVLLMLDNDIPGQMAQAKLMGQFVEFGARVYKVNYDAEDPGAIRHKDEILNYERHIF